MVVLYCLASYPMTRNYIILQGLPISKNSFKFGETCKNSAGSMSISYYTIEGEASGILSIASPGFDSGQLTTSGFNLLYYTD